MSGIDWEQAVAERDERIAAIEAQVAEAARNAETAEQLRGEIAELKAQSESVCAMAHTFSTCRPTQRWRGATLTGAVSGIAPTADANFATKKYVDDAIAALDDLSGVSF